MAQTRGILPALTDNVKKSLAAPITPIKRETIPGLMHTRNMLRSMRSSTLPKSVKPRTHRRGGR